MFEFEAWHIWILLAAGLAVGELVFSGFVLLAFAVACLVGAAMDYWTLASVTSQIMVTIVAGSILTPAFVWYYRNKFAPQKPGPMDVGWEKGVQTKTVESSGRVGVKLKGDFYPAKLEDDESPELGQKVEVLRLEGITAIVSVVSE